MKPVLLIHGGAGSVTPDGERAELFRVSLQRIVRSVYPKLLRGSSAVSAVVAAVSMLEDDPLYNAGRGSKIQSDGVIRMSASVMDGEARRFAGCVNVFKVRNPIQLARLLLKEDDRVLEGNHAERYAKGAGLQFRSPYTKERREAFDRAKRGFSGTVGAVVLDSKGRLAAATSTGGKGMEFPGRVSDTPTVAANFANRHCAVSATGTGEEIVEFGTAASLCGLVEHGLDFERSAAGIIRSAKRDSRRFGFIAVDRRGRIFAQTATKHLIWASAGPDGEIIHQ